MKRRMKIVATTSLPAVDRPNADRWNAARSRQFCTDCALNTCVCSLVKLELKIEALKLNEEVLRNEKKKRKRDAEDEEEVKQQDSQPVFGSNAAEQERLGQQLHQQALDGGAAAPQKVEREDQKQERGGKAESLKPSEIRRREKSAKKRRKCEGQGQAVQQTISTYLRTKPTQLHPVDIITPTQPSIERSTPTNETIIWVEARPAMPPGVPTQEKLLTSPPTQIPQPPRNSRMLRVENHSSPLVDWRPENKPSPSPPPNIPHSPKASKAIKNDLTEKPQSPTQPPQRDKPAQRILRRGTTAQPTQLEPASTPAQSPQLEASMPAQPTQLEVSSTRPTQWEVRCKPTSTANTNPVLVEADQQPALGANNPAKKNVTTPSPTQPSKIRRSSIIQLIQLKLNVLCKSSTPAKPTQQPQQATRPTQPSEKETICPTPGTYKSLPPPSQRCAKVKPEKLTPKPSFGQFEQCH